MTVLKSTVLKTALFIFSKEKCGRKAKYLKRCKLKYLL